MGSAWGYRGGGGAAGGGAKKRGGEGVGKFLGALAQRGARMLLVALAPQYGGEAGAALAGMLVQQQIGDQTAGLAPLGSNVPSRRIEQPERPDQPCQTPSQLPASRVGDMASYPLSEILPQGFAASMMRFVAFCRDVAMAHTICPGKHLRCNQTIAIIGILERA